MTTRYSLPLVFAGLTGLLAASCGGSSGGGGQSFSGTVHGQSIHPLDAVSAPLSVSAQDSVGVILIANDSGICSDLTSNVQPPNSQVILLALAQQNPGTGRAEPPMATGTYVVTQQASSATMAATAQITFYDAQCAKDTAHSAQGTGGSVNLTSISGNAYSGTFDLTLDSGDHVTGSFNSSSCSALATALSSQGAPTCM
jgi:hypothetical protein